MLKVEIKLRTEIRSCLNMILCPCEMYRIFKQIDTWCREDNLSSAIPVIREHKVWKKRFRAIMRSAIHNEVKHRYKRVIESFYKSRIECLKDFAGTITDDEVILLATVKNDLPRLDMFLSHYRKLGVRHFVFIDNDSNDGTPEKIIKQTDCACFSTKVKFEPSVKEGWFNRVAAHYGIKRWYIIVDSDELLAYPKMEKLPINEYVKLADRLRCTCIKTIMLDVYPSGQLMDEGFNDTEYMERCVYFDRADLIGQDANYIINHKENCVSGGMRSRVFPAERAVKLTKPSLMRFDKVFLISAHKVYPRETDFTSVHAGVVLHYKFLPSDKDRYLEFEETGIHYDGSRIYKDINKKIRQAPEISAFSELSEKWDSVKSWQHLPFIKDLTEMVKEG